MSEERARIRQSLIAKFQSIARERVDRINNAFVEIERDPAAPTAEANATLLMREVHTLKGEAKLMGFEDINLVAHRAEDLLGRARSQGFRIPASLADLILRSFDTIGHLLQKQAGRPAGAPDLDGFLAQVDAVLGSPREAGPAPSAPPPPAQAAPEPDWRAAPAEPAEVSIRVDLARIDALVDLAGELMLQHRRLSHGLRQIERATQGEARGQLARTGGDLVETGYLLEELQGTVRDLRLLPLRTLFDRYPRPIRDLARDHGKSIRVAMEGGELEADKRVLDLLGEPLLHLIRNAVDHGIESPRDRVAAGKPEEGNLTLVARHAAGRLEIVVRDDGRGLSEQAIRDVALTRGAISREEAEELRADQVIELLFQPGFSTKSATTDISGRGIGLHIVKQAVENLGGSVSVRSTPGQETSFVLDVPLTVALLQALVVSLDKLQLAIPSHAVSGVHRVSEGQLLAAGTGSAFRVDGALIALQDLGRLLGAGELSVPLAECRVVVVESKGNALGLIVPRVLGERELVQRPLDPFLRAIPKLVGAAILESGDPVLVLNVAEAVRAAASGPRAGARPEPGAEARERCVLIVEDSELTRDMLQRLVGALGHRVIEAVNGREALRRIAIQRPDLVLTDLEMPVMDGFQLIAEIRALEPLRDVPIVVLSSRGSPEDQRRAAALGADAYLVKSEFSEKALADTFARFLQEAAG